MKTKGTILKRTKDGKVYYYHKYLLDGVQKNDIIPENDAYRLAFECYFKGNDRSAFLSHEFQLDVAFGQNLRALAKPYEEFRKRFCYEDVTDFLTKPYVGKVLILYGLRRTGKTTLMFQSINDFSLKDFAKAAYVKCSSGKTIYHLFEDLKYLTENGFSYIFIDEVTFLEDFASLSSTISDIYGLRAKIVLTGTDSLGFLIASHHELYDRCKMVHTTYIPFREFREVLGEDSIDKFIEYGGTMSMEGIDYNKQIQKGHYRANEYVDSSIIHNIVHSLESVDEGKFFFNLFDLHQRHELENVINRIIEDSNHRFAISVIEADFKSHDYGALKKLLSMPRNYERFHDVLDGVDEKKLTEDLMDALNIINKEKQTHKIDDTVLRELEQYLLDLDVLASIDEASYPTFETWERMIFTQPGLRYSQAKALVDILLRDPKLQQYDVKLLSALKEKLLSDVKGRMLEDLVIYETSRKRPHAFKFYFGVKGEYDMATYDEERMESEIFEIKYSATIDPGQYKYLVDEDLRKIFEAKYYPIAHRYVLYRGENTTRDGVEYRNVEDYLAHL